MYKATFKIGEKQYILRIEQDEYSESPRSWDNVCTMVYWHKRYDLGDKHGYKTPDDFMEEIQGEWVVIQPIYLYDHSGLSISTKTEYPFNDRWDSMQVGWIYVTKERIQEEWADIGDKWEEKAREWIEIEVKTYDQYLTNDVYRFSLKEVIVCDKCGHEEEEYIDDRYGLFGDEWEESVTGSLNAMDGMTDELLQDVMKQLSVWVNK